MPAPPVLAIADDDPDHANLLAAWLQHQGYRVLHFGSGDALVEWAAETAPAVDGFLLDLEMPGRDGLASYDELRNQGYAATPAVLVSGAREEGLQQRAADVGVRQVVRKDAEMLSNLQQWLTKHLPPTIVSDGG